MIFAINGYTKEYISLIKDTIGVEYTGKNFFLFCFQIFSTGKKQLLEYEIQMWDLFIITSSIASEAEIRIVFRRYFLYLSKSYIEIIHDQGTLNFIFLGLLFNKSCCY